MKKKESTQRRAYAAAWRKEGGGRVCEQRIGRELEVGERREEKDGSQLMPGPLPTMGCKLLLDRHVWGACCFLTWEMGQEMSRGSERRPGSHRLY